MKILSNETAQHYQLASLNRGHVVFTSFISQRGKILFLGNHLERLLKGAHFLFPQFAWMDSYQELENYVLDLFDKDTSDSYFRLTLFDDSLHLERRAFTPSKDLISIATAFKVKTIGLNPPFLKISHYLESDLEIQNAKKNGFDEVIFFDPHEALTEASSSNVFIVTDDGIVKTPPLSSMVLDGVLRKVLIKELKNQKIILKEAPLYRADLEHAREVWLTNAVKGLRLVKRFDQKNYEVTSTLFEKVMEQFGKYGELI